MFVPRTTKSDYKTKNTFPRLFTKTPNIETKPRTLARVCLRIWRFWEQTRDKRNENKNIFPRLFTYLVVLGTNAGKINKNKKARRVDAPSSIYLQALNNHSTITVPSKNSTANYPQQSTHKTSITRIHCEKRKLSKTVKTSNAIL